MILSSISEHFGPDEKNHVKRRFEHFVGSVAVVHSVLAIPASRSLSRVSSLAPSFRTIGLLSFGLSAAICACLWFCSGDSGPSGFSFSFSS